MRTMQIGFVASVAFVVALLPVEGRSATVANAAAQPPREITVLVGAEKDTVTAVPMAFFPQNVRVRAGDTVTWVHNGGLDHTVSFVAGTTPVGPARPRESGLPGDLMPVNIPFVPDGPPGLTMLNPEEIFASVDSGSTYSGRGFFNSGHLGREPMYPGGPIRERFSLVFDSPGAYEYVCLLHQEFRMVGNVEVAPADAVDVPDQVAIDAQAQAEMAILTGRMEQARARSQDLARSAPGPNGTTLWFVFAGNTQNAVRDLRVQLFEFVPKDTTVQAGDTVIWESRFVHSVTFVPLPPPPDRFLPEFQSDGSVRIIRNPSIFDPERPSPVYDPARQFNSAPLGPWTQNGVTWALTFERPGTFEYFCAIHREEGMTGSITVVPRS